MTRIPAFILSASITIAGQDAGAQPAVPDAGTRSVAAIRLAAGEPVDLDGNLDEPFWKRAVPAGDFRQIDPTNALLTRELDVSLLETQFHSQDSNTTSRGSRFAARPPIVGCSRSTAGSKRGNSIRARGVRRC